MLKFKGYFTKEQVDELPNDKTGLYLVFDYLLKEENRYINRLVYIGKTDDTDSLRQRMNQHINNDFTQWKEEIGLAEDNFCFSYALYEENDVTDIEADLIYKYQPIINNEGKKYYSGRKYCLYLSGAIDYLMQATLIDGIKIEYNILKQQKGRNLISF